MERHESDGRMSRYEILLGLGALAGAIALSGCGNKRTENGLIVPGDSVPPGELIIAGPADVDVQARRGTAFQATDTVPPPPRTWQAGQFVSYSKVDRAIAALNYDDGPSIHNTDPILRMLAKHGIRATFYLIGVNMIAHPEIVQRIHNEGHEIGTHSMFHDKYIASWLASQTPEVRQLVYDMIKEYPVSDRTPGLTNGQILLDVNRSLGMYQMHTTIDSMDWKSPRISAGSIYNNVIRSIHWGAAPLQHDGGSRRPTPDAQEAIIVELLRQGYEFMTVTDMINSGQPMPGTFGYSSPGYRQSNDIPQQIEPEVTTPAEDVCAIACNYDPIAELKERLDHPRIKRQEKSRINEALAMYDDYLKQAS